MIRATLAALALAAAPALAAAQDITRVATGKPVAKAADALAAAIEPAGITLFARVNHGKGARMVDEDIGDAELMIFGNPKVGTPALKANPLAGIMLPLRVLVYEDATGQTWLAYHDPADMLAGLDGIAADAPYVRTMTKALANFTARAAE
jgi:uncharacterized protein (DUF302 family)